MQMTPCRLVAVDDGVSFNRNRPFLVWARVLDVSCGQSMPVVPGRQLLSRCKVGGLALYIENPGADTQQPVRKCEVLPCATSKTE